MRELEDFIINECFATARRALHTLLRARALTRRLQGVIKGKLDQRRGCLEVHWALGRDIKEGQLQRMLTQLAKWCALCVACVCVLASLWRSQQCGAATKLPGGFTG